MLRAFLWLCVFLVAGAGMYYLVTQGSGYLLLVWDKTSVEMSLWFALICLLLLFFVLWFVFSLLRGSFRGMADVKRKLFGYADQKAQLKTIDGLIDFIEGDWRGARRKLTRSANKVNAPIINYLAAARSAYEMGDQQVALELLHKAETSTDKGGLAVAITQARMQLGNQQYEQALATLERTTSTNPEHPMVLSLRQQVYLALKDWLSLKSLLPQLTRNGIVDSIQRRSLELTLYQSLLDELIEKQKNAEPEKKLEQLQTLWNDIPTDMQREKNVLTTYVSQLMGLGEHQQAEKLLATGLNRQWCGQWVDLYGLLLLEDPKKPLQQAEKWLVEHNDNANLMLALGRLCLQNQQWGRAIDYFEKSVALTPRPEAYAELARVLNYIGEDSRSEKYCKEGLLSSVKVMTADSVFAKAKA